MDVTLLSGNVFTAEIIQNPFPKTEERKKKDVQGQFTSQQIIPCNSLLPSGCSSDEHVSPFRQELSNKSVFQVVFV